MYYTLKAGSYIVTDSAIDIESKYSIIRQLLPLENLYDVVSAGKMYVTKAFLTIKQKWNVIQTEYLFWSKHTYM